MVNKRDLVNRIRSNFPAELRDLAQWVCWRIESRDDKPTKVPYSVNGHRAASDNPATWASFDAACKAFLNGNYNGVGFMFSAHDPYVGIDFDKCIDHAGNVDPAKWDLICKLGSYTERSQSGTGIHIIARGMLPPGGRKSNQHQIEIYDRLRFFVVTGDVLPDYHPGIEDRQAQIEQFHKLIFPAKEQATQQHHTNGNGQIPADDQALLDRMFSSRNGADIQALWNGDKTPYNGDESAADLALCNYLAFWTGNDAARMDRLFRQSRLYREYKWDRPARTGEKYGEGTIARSIAATKETYSPRRQETNTIATVESVAPTLHKTNNGSHNHAEPNATDGYAQPEEKASAVDALRYRAEDGGILDAWVEHYSEKWLYAVGKDRWHYWNSTHWALDESLMLQSEIRQLLDEMNRQCSQYMQDAPNLIEAINKRYGSIAMPDSAIDEIENIQKKATIAKAMHAATKRTNGRIASIEGEGMAKSVRAVAESRLDISESINLANGTLNLRSLELLPHDRADLFTYCLPYAYDPNARCPLFEKFISEVLVKEDSTETDPQLVMLFQELLGYSLTPQTKREVMVWMFGEGGNGKSVALSVVKALLGPMAISVDFQTLGKPGNYDLADIPGTRVIFSSEAERGGDIAEGYIKKIVTGDPINTRPIYGSPINFSSTAKIWWAMNDKPTIKDTTDSIWRRMKLIPFYRKFEEGKNADVDLPEKLKAELPGILNWALRGLMRLTVNNKFTEASAADEAKKQYRNESNPVAQWVNTMTVRTSYPATLQGALYTKFKAWCIDNGERPITSNQFSRDLKRLKIDGTHRNTGAMYNLALIDDQK